MVSALPHRFGDGGGLRRLLHEAPHRKGRHQPDAVVIGEPTDLDVYRGQRGRVDATITTHGVSAHGAHAHRGVNALYKMAPIIGDIEALNGRLAEDEFLGKGSVIVSSIECTTPSLNAVPDSARIYIDRRLTAAKPGEIVMEELRSLPHLGDAEVEIPHYDAVSWTGHSCAAGEVLPDLGARRRTTHWSRGSPRRRRVFSATRRRSRAGPSRPTASRPWGSSESPLSASPPAAKNSPTPPRNRSPSKTSSNQPPSTP